MIRICLVTFAAISLLTCVGLLAGCASDEVEAPRVVLHTSHGDILIEVDPDKAPITASNFLRYVDEARYRSAVFYRVVTPGNQPENDVRIEVIQGGLFAENAPTALPPITHETTEVTGIRHRDGTVSMARTEPGTAASEIFICLGDQPELDFGGGRNPDGQGFAAFGRVVEGMDVVRRIQRLPETGQYLDEPVPITGVERANAEASGSSGRNR